MAYNNLCASSGSIIGNVGCFLPLSKTASVTHLTELENRFFSECNGQHGTCDCAPPPPAKCDAGHCKGP